MDQIIRTDHISQIGIEFLQISINRRTMIAKVDALSELVKL